MLFTDLLRPDCIVADLRATSRHALLEALARLLAPSGADLAVLEALTEREALGSTALGNGMAVPHGRCAELAEPAGAFVRLARPIPFGDGGPPVDLVAALVTPTHFTATHLGLLADIATRASDPKAVQALRDAPDVTALRAELAKWGQPG